MSKTDIFGPEVRVHPLEAPSLPPTMQTRESLLDSPQTRTSRMATMDDEQMDLTEKAEKCETPVLP